MRLLTMPFHRFRIPSFTHTYSYVTTAGRALLYVYYTGHEHERARCTQRSKGSVIMTDGGLDHSISLALQLIGCPSVTLKAEQRACIKSGYEGKRRFPHVAYRLW